MMINRAFKCCSPISDYEILDKVGEGTFGEVFKALSLKSPMTVALKRITFPGQIEKDDDTKRRLESEGIPLLFIRETRILKCLHHPNVIELIDVVVDPSGDRFYHAFPFVESDLAGLIDANNLHFQFTHSRIKRFLIQILEGLNYLHLNDIIHRDLKPANILISSNGLARITDFGLARPVDPDRSSSYTPRVVTRWYRAPEICLGARDYTTAVDLWSVGCIMAEMILRRPLLAGESDIGQLLIIMEICGHPTNVHWPKWRDLPEAQHVPRMNFKGSSLSTMFQSEPPEFVWLLNRLLTLNPSRRISAFDALDSEYFWTLPAPATLEEMPRIVSSHEYNTQAARERRLYIQQQNK